MGTPYQILIRLTPALGLSYTELHDVGGRMLEGDPQPISGVEDPVVAEFAALFNAEVAEALAVAQARIAELEAGGATAPDTDYVPMHGLRKALRTVILPGGLTALDAIVAYINDVDHLEERAALRDDFEYAPYVRRNHSSVLAMQALLQQTDEQVDALFALAKTLA